jgi:hypothetical protein
MQKTIYLFRAKCGVMAVFGSATLAIGLWACLPSYAQTIEQVASPTLNSQSPGVKSITPAIPTQTPPRWIDLTLSQQDSLMPLAATWNTLGQSHKRKWIALAQNYPSIAAPEQAKLHSRMAEWAALSPAKREEARLNFSTTKKIAPPERASNWEAYKALSPQERASLASGASAKSKGAATAVKPVVSEKLTTVPITRRSPIQLRELAFSKQSIDRHTLLPLAARPNADSLPTKN